jgi:NADH dehydrogenase
VREGSDPGDLVAAGAEPVSGDLKDRESLDKALAGVDAVVTTANAASRAGTDTIETVDRLGNRNLLAAAEHAGARRFVFVSALGADPASPVPLMRARARPSTHCVRAGSPGRSSRRTSSWTCGYPRSSVLRSPPDNP